MPRRKTGLKQGKPLQRKTEMPRGAGLKREANPPAKKSSGQAKTNRGLDPLKAQARRRDGDRCVKCGVHLYGGGNVHHRRNRGLGGSSKANVISNLITLCGTPLTLCHGEVTLKPEKCDAFGNGWRLSTNGTSNPATEPVLVEWLGWALPLADGTWQAIDAREVA
ncbi:hypothetical protein FH608_046530 [Nonomuraea phyllanthi]|uniref:HNH endonuclease n=1 Tax=Nonomuraea phyllanthi TaxID=2219224 RepID=A0A8E0W5W6_9ACTN|nr:HNH endonuclease [Nonomuraea phyllanthi]KAB8186950.1 hypothetical protein FH608_046530 [Nonomuraea phyllanthi]